MKKNKQRNRLLVIMVTFLLILNIKPVAAASSISVSVKDSYYSDEPVTITINASHDSDVMWDINVSSPQLSLSSLKGQGKRIFVGTSRSISENVGKLSVGSYTVSADTGKSTEMAQNKGVSANTSRTFKVISRSADTSGNKPADKPNIPTNDGKENTTTQKTEAQLAAEKKAREEAEAEREKAALEEAKLTPLFSEINIVSNSEKMKGDVLTTVKSEKSKFDYAFTLPKRIDSFKLDLKAVEGATLTYDKEHTIEEGKDSIVVPVKAVSGEISQDFKITISRNSDKPVMLKVGDNDLTVYDDELLDEAMKSFEFEKKTFEQGEEKVPYFTKGSMSLVLLLEDDLAVWHSLDKKMKVENAGVLYIDESNNALFILEAGEEATLEQLYGNKYSEKTLEINEALVSVDSKLKFKDTYQSWNYDENREVVYGFDSTGDRDFYVFGDNKIKAAVVAFDAVDKKYQMISWGLGGVLFSLVGTGSLFGIAQKKNGNGKNDELTDEESLIK